MTNSLDQIKEFVGVDVSQDRLDVYLLPDGQAGLRSAATGAAWHAWSPGLPVGNGCWWWSRRPAVWSGR